MKQMDIKQLYKENWFFLKSCGIDTKVLIKHALEQDPSLTFRMTTMQISKDPENLSSEEYSYSNMLEFVDMIVLLLNEYIRLT